MTPISFALEILLDCESIEKAHKAARKYIKELEKAQIQSPNNQNTRPSIPMPPRGPVQAPSTQRILDEMAAEGKPLTLPILPGPKPGERVDKETGRPMVPTGNGTFGAKKW